MRSRLVAWSPLLGALAVVAVVIGIASIGHPNAAGGPPILRLTSAGGAGGENALASDASVRSYAGGPATVSGTDGYTLQGQLPDGPGSAAVRRWTATAAPDSIERLARALGLTGAAKREGDNWVVRSGTAATLRVSTKAGNPWTYVRDE